MTRTEIAIMIAGIGLPYAYDHFSKDDAQSPPFICFLYPNSDDFLADNINYARITALVIELYTDEVDFDLEAAVESTLIAAELPYTKVQTYIDSEKMYQTSYNTEVLLHAPD